MNETSGSSRGVGNDGLDIDSSVQEGRRVTPRPGTPIIGVEDPCYGCGRTGDWSRPQAPTIPAGEENGVPRLGDSCSPGFKDNPGGHFTKHPALNKPGGRADGADEVVHGSGCPFRLLARPHEPAVRVRHPDRPDPVHQPGVRPDARLRGPRAGGPAPLRHHPRRVALHDASGPRKPGRERRTPEVREGVPAQGRASRPRRARDRLRPRRPGPGAGYLRLRHRHHRAQEGRGRAQGLRGTVPRTSTTRPPSATM